MSDSNPFDDLATDDDDVESDDRDTETTHTDAEASPEDAPEGDPDRSKASHPVTEPVSEASPSRDTSLDGPTLENSSPPFPYSDAEQKQMYVRSGLWDEFEDLEFDAELELRRTFEVRNVEQREIDTAVVRLVVDQLSPREIAEMVVQMRGFEASSLD